MSTASAEPSEREQRLNAVLAEYLEAVEAGRPPDRDEWLRQHPELAEELKLFLANRQQIDQIAAPARAVAAAADPAKAATIASNQPVPSPGTMVRYVGDYELLEEIARGGMGVVYKARQVSLNRIAAVKMILAGQFASAADVQRFRTEAESAGNLDHPNIVPIYEVGDYHGQPYFSMKLIDGGSLSKKLSSFCRETKASVALLATVARAVHHAHQRGIIHRDLKPANILLDAQSQPHITDFGLAKHLTGDSGMTHTGQIVGTPSYMAPEQAAGKKNFVTTATDVYALGAVLYQMLTGRVPFIGETPMEVIHQVIEKDPEPPSTLVSTVDRDLEAICLKCLAKDPQQRYASAAALADDLDHWLNGEPLCVRPPSIVFLMRLWVRRHLRTTLWTVLIGFVSFGLGTGLLSLFAAGDILPNVADTYTHFPSLKPPAVAFAWRPPTWVVGAAFAAGLVLVANLGTLTHWLVGPKDRTGDLVAGLAGGLIAGISAFLFGLGWASVLAVVIVPSVDDIHLYERALRVKPVAAGQPDDAAMVDLAEVAARKYPDLRALPPRERPRLLADKIVNDQVVAALTALWWSVFWVLGSHLGAGVIQTLAAGYVLRRGDQFPAFFGPYVELTVPISGFWGWLITWALIGWQDLHVDAAEVWLALLTWAALTVLGLAGVVRRWPWPLRWMSYTVCVLTSLRLSGGYFVPPAIPLQHVVLPWYVDAVAWAGVAILVASYFDWRRHVEKELLR